MSQNYEIKSISPVQIKTVSPVKIKSVSPVKVKSVSPADISFEAPIMIESVESIERSPFPAPPISSDEDDTMSEMSINISYAPSLADVHEKPITPRLFVKSR